MRKLSITAMVVLILLLVLDWISTLKGLLAGRCETNPLILVLARHIGIAEAVTAIKVLDAVIVIGFYKILKRHPEYMRAGFFMIATIDALYAAVVINNFS